MTSQTPEERIADVEKILGKPFATWMPEPTVNSTVLYGYPKEHLEQSFHHQQQKHRETWLREEIVKLKSMFRYERSMSATMFDQALQTIIDRYQSELDQDITN